MVFESQFLKIQIWAYLEANFFKESKVPTV